MVTLDYAVICFIFKNLQFSQETQNPPIRASWGFASSRSAPFMLGGCRIQRSRSKVPPAIADTGDVDRLADALKDARGSYLSALRCIRNSGGVRLRRCCEGRPTRTRRGPDPMASEPLHPSLMTRQSWLVDRLFLMLLEDVRNGAHRYEIRARK